MYLPTLAIFLLILSLSTPAMSAPLTSDDVNFSDRDALFKRALDGLDFTYLTKDPTISRRTWPLWNYGSGDKECDCSRGEDAGTGSGSVSAGVGVGVAAGGTVSGGGSGMICISGDLAGQLVGEVSAGAGAGAEAVWADILAKLAEMKEK